MSQNINAELLNSYAQINVPMVVLLGCERPFSFTGYKGAINFYRDSRATRVQHFCLDLSPNPPLSSHKPI